MIANHLCRNLVILVLILGMLMAAPAIAQVTNPSFEAGGTGWGTYGGGAFVTAPPGTYFGMTAQQGTGFWAAVRNFGNQPNPEGIFQTVTTTAGVTYTLTVAGQAHNRTNDTGGNEFVYIPGQGASDPNTDVRLGIDLTGGTNPTAGSVSYGATLTTGAQWQDLSRSFTATGPATTIFLDSLQPFAFEGNWTGFDNVRLVAQPLQAVPEPATIAIWSVLGAAALLFARWRKRANG
jgi:hypothetical protein